MIPYSGFHFSLHGDIRMDSGCLHSDGRAVGLLSLCTVQYESQLRI